jgi:predicted Zn finger-like uncharacterized protein
MPLGVDCPSCQHKFMVPDKMSGRGVKCPRCEHAFTAPNGQTPGSYADLLLAPVGAAALPVPISVPAGAPMQPPSPVTAMPNLPAASLALGQGGTTLRSVGTPRRRLTQLVLDLPEAVMRNAPRPLQGTTGLAFSGLLAGLLACGLSTWAKLDAAALAVASLGILFAAVAAAALLRRHEPGLALPIAAVLVDLQAILFAATAVFAGSPEENRPAPLRPPTASTVVARLRQQLKDSDEKERLQAAFALTELARDLNKSVLDLMNLLADPQRNTRAAAAEALGLIGPQARIAYPALAGANRADSDENVRTKAKEAMKKIAPPGPADVAFMVDTFSDRKQLRQLRAAAAQVLGLIGNEARVTVPALEEGLKDPDAQVRVSAALALWLLV